MSSLSLSRIPRRLQLALLVVVVLGILWVGVLQRLINSNSSSTPEATSAAPAPIAHVHHATGALSSHAKAKAAAAAALAHRNHNLASAKHGSASAKSLAGAHAKAHAASPTSPTRPAARHAGAAASAATGAHALGGSHAAGSAAAIGKAKLGSKGAAGGADSLNPQVKAIEERLGEGKVVLLLFWNHESTTDQFVQGEAQAAARSLGKRVSLQLATAAQVGEFGTFTQQVLITETPTLLLIGSTRDVHSIAGFTEAETIKRAVEEIEHTRSSH